MKHILKQFIFGIDTIIALSSYLFFISIPGAHPSMPLVAASLFFSYLPDLDLIIFFIFRKKFKWKSHWIIFHHPIILIPASVFIAILSASLVGEDKKCLVLMALINVTAHFFHDSCDSVGFPWFSPFNRKRYRFKDGKFVQARQEDIDKKYDRFNHLNPLGSEISLRLEKISPFQIMISILLITATIVSLI